MSEVKTTAERLTTVANNERTIADNAKRVYDAGYAKGKAEGGGGIDYDKFWDNFQNYGQPTIYFDAFARNRFDDETYNPKYPIVCVNVDDYYPAEKMFYNNGQITDTKVPIDIRGVGNDLYVMYDTFRCDDVESHLETIRTLYVTEDTAYNSAFVGCVALKNITFEGEIGNSISFKYSPLLTRASIENVLEHLSTTSTGKKVTFNKNAVNAAFTDEEWTEWTGKRGNWTYGLSEG